MIWTEDAGKLAVKARADRCEVTGWAGDLEWAHRLAAGQGGSWAPWNGCRLTRRFHAWCHAHPLAAQVGGWIVESHRDPLYVPVWLRLPWPAWWTFVDAQDGGPHLLEEVDPANYDLPKIPALPTWAAAA